MNLQVPAQSKLLRSLVRTSGLLLAALCAGAWAPAQAEWLYRDAPIMGTRCDVELWTEDRLKGEAAISAVFDEMRRIDNEFSTFKPQSEVSRVNDLAAKSPMRISKELFDLIQTSIDYSKLTRGTFDITYASVGYMYNYPEHVRPSEAQIAAALPESNYRHIHLDRAAQTVFFDHAGVRIDFGGIGKGYAVDRGIAVLQKLGITRAMVNAGGDSRIIGDRFGKPWLIGIRDPDDRNRTILRIPLTDTAFSTSGDYERFFDEGGVRYHHILDPRTGKSPHVVRSVTIIGPEATRTDALTKSVFVMGVKEGIDFINTLPDIDVVAITPDRKVWYSKGLENPEKPAASAK
ncbi:MAG TPA: FAD:protein FMN transferase [Steroidobacteraceae bacterium]|nr:FAD:protein FMN transferase [Steroidobacteraceae bacterium]